MRKLLNNRLYLMLVSVLIAFVMWVSVVSISNPDTTGSKAVTVEERNASAITSAGKAYTIQGNKTVKINYTVQARDAYKVKSTDFRAYVDLSDIYDTTGSVRVVVQTVNNQDIISDCSAVPQTMQVIVEDIITKTVNVKVYTVDRCPDGYEAAASTTSLTQVNITGPESLIDSIAVAGVEVSVKDATTTLSGEAYLKFYDSDKSDAHVVDVSGNKFFSASAYKTDYTLYVNTAKTVPIQYEIGGTPASGYHYSSTSASIGSVIVMGDSDALGKLSAITIPSSVLNIDGATSSKLWNVDLNAYLPAGTTISGTHQTSITAVIEADTSSSSGGPGVTTAPETTSASSETGNAETTAGTSETTEAAGGPGVTVTEPDKETEEGSDIQDETQAESQAETESESQSPGESSSHVTTGASADHTSYERTEVPAQTQSHTQAETHAETEPETQAETQSHMQQ